MIIINWKTYLQDCSMDGQSIWLCSKEKRGVQIERGECFVIFTWWSWVNDSQAAQSGNLTHWCLAPIDIVNLWKAGNRIIIMIGALGCTQVRTSNSCSSKRKKDFGNLFFWVRNILPRGLIGLLTKMAKTNFWWSLRVRARRRARGLIFRHSIGVEIPWGSVEKIIKIWPTVAEQSV